MVRGDQVGISSELKVLLRSFVIYCVCSRHVVTDKTSTPHFSSHNGHVNCTASSSLNRQVLKTCIPRGRLFGPTDFFSDFLHVQEAMNQVVDHLKTTHKAVGLVTPHRDGNGLKVGWSTTQQSVCMFWRDDAGRGELIRDVRRKSKPVEPFAEFTEEGDKIWNDLFGEKDKTTGQAASRRARRGRESQPSVSPTADRLEPFSPSLPLPLSPPLRRQNEVR